MAKGAVDLELDPASLAQFKRAIDLYRRATKKDEAAILNRAGHNVILRAIQFTPKANKGRKPLNKAWDPEAERGKRGNRKAIRYWRGAWKRQGKRGTPTREDLHKMWSNTRARIGYLKAGWLNAARDFARAAGRNPPKGRPFSRGDANKGYARPARASLRVEALATNFADAADRFGKAPLERAMRYVAIDIINYAQRKLGLTAKKYSAKDIRALSK